VEQKQANSRSIPHQKTSTKGEKKQHSETLLKLFFSSQQSSKKELLRNHVNLGLGFKQILNLQQEQILNLQPEEEMRADFTWKRKGGRAGGAEEKMDKHDGQLAA
jgi:hypothetical protein